MLLTGTSTAKSFIDLPVYRILEYFTGQMNAYLIIAVRIGVLFALIGIIWNCLQMVFGTMEQRKFLVGIVTKWFLFLFCLTFYPSISMGLKTFAIQMGTFVSGSTADDISTRLGNYVESLEKTLYATRDNAKDNIDKLKKEQTDSGRKAARQSLSTMSGGRYYNSDYEFKMELESAQKNLQEIEDTISSIDSDNPKGIAKKINAIKSVLSVDGQDISRKYTLDLSLKDVNGNDTGFLSPNAMLRMTLLGAQIMWQTFWEDGIVKEMDESAKKGLIKVKMPWDFPLQAIFDAALLFLTEILEIAITCIELIQYVMCIIEFVICITFGIVLIPCLLFDGLKDMAMKLMPTLLSQTVKLAMITICMFFCCHTYLDITMTLVSDTQKFNILTFSYVAFTILLTFALCSNAPKLACALLTGQPQMSMGEFVQAAGAIAGGTVAGVKATRSAIGGGARAAANRLGDLAAMKGGFEGASQKAGIEGKTGFGKAMAGVKGAAKTLGTRTGNRIKGAMQNAATYKGGRGGGFGGGSGGGGAGANQFGYNNRGINPETKHGYGHETQQHQMNYAGHQNAAEMQSSLKEYMAAQKEDAFLAAGGTKTTDADAPHPDSPENTPSDGGPSGGTPSDGGPSGGGDFYPPDIGGGAMSPARYGPIFFMDSSVSYTPPMRNVTPKPEGLPSPSLPDSKKKRNLLDGSKE